MMSFPAGILLGDILCLFSARNLPGSVVPKVRTVFQTKTIAMAAGKAWRA